MFDENKVKDLNVLVDYFMNRDVCKFKEFKKY